MGARNLVAHLADWGARTDRTARGRSLASAEASPPFGTDPKRPAFGAESSSSTLVSSGTTVSVRPTRKAGAFLEPFLSDRLRSNRAHPFVGH